MSIDCYQSLDIDLKDCLHNWMLLYMQSKGAGKANGILSDRKIRAC